jgi:hypothetical protein
MHTTCFDEYLLCSGDTKIADEIAVLQSVSSMFGARPRLCAHVSVTCISVLCMTCPGVSYGIHVYVLTLS